MNIKEIIDAERWGFSGSFGTDMNSMQHNASLDRIEAAVSYHIVEGNKMVSDLRNPSDGGEFERVIAGIPFATVKMFAGDIADITDAHNADRAADKQRIAELEEQLPKVVRPIHWVTRLGDDMFECSSCHRKVKGNKNTHKSCQCGAKLDWSDA